MRTVVYVDELTAATQPTKPRQARYQPARVTKVQAGPAGEGWRRAYRRAHFVCTCMPCRLFTRHETHNGAHIAKASHNRTAHPAVSE
ncbi:MAG TPA: hypothetical protein VGH54_21245 [Mycobacterium sp.]|uniref:hypothetical protein n=1 Tax=Mycobacterium sp. TaxID=1785 RepID=UPI002F409D37